MAVVSGQQRILNWSRQKKGAKAPLFVIKKWGGSTARD